MLAMNPAADPDRLLPILLGDVRVNRCSSLDRPDVKDLASARTVARFSHEISLESSNTASTRVSAGASFSCFNSHWVRRRAVPSLGASNRGDVVAFDVSAGSPHGWRSRESGNNEDAADNGSAAQG